MKKQTIGQVALYKQLFRDNRDFFRIVKILGEEVASDGGSYHLQAETVTDSLECLLNMSFDPALQSPAKKDDIWLAGFVNGDLNNGIAIQRLYNMTAPLHPKAREGETVLSSRTGKKINVSNDHTATLTENAVLGPELVKWLLKLTAEIKSLADDLESLKNTYNSHNHNYIDTIGGPTTPVPTPKITTANAGQSSVTTAPEKSKIEGIEQEGETDKFLSDLLFVQERKLPNSPES